MTIAVTQGSMTVSPGGGQSKYFNSPPGLTPFYVNVWTADPADQIYFVVYNSFAPDFDAWTSVPSVGVSFNSTAPGDITVRFVIIYTDESVTHLPAYEGE